MPAALEGGLENAADPASLAEPSPSGWPKKGRGRPPAEGRPLRRYRPRPGRPPPYTPTRPVARSRPVHPACSGAPARGTGIASEKMLKSRTGAPKEGEMRERRTTVGGVHASAPSFIIVRSSHASRYRFHLYFWSRFVGHEPLGCGPSHPPDIGGLEERRSQGGLVGLGCRPVWARTPTSTSPTAASTAPPDRPAMGGRRAGRVG